MIVGEIIQRVISAYNRGVQSDDSRLTPRHVYNKLLTVRSKLISEEAKKKQKINQWNFQVLPCVELQKAYPNECPCVPPLGCEILRSVHKLPKPLSNYDNHIIDSVTDLNGDVRFDEITWKEKRLKNANKYTAEKPDYYIHNGYLFITHKLKIRVITITGVFEDPFAEQTFPSFCDEKCTDCDECVSMLDKEFPFDQDMIDAFVEIAAIELIDRFRQNQQDTLNNSRDDIAEENK